LSIASFSVENTLRANKANIIDLLEYFNKTPNQITVIENQWRKLHLIDWNNTSNTGECWTEVANYKDARGILVFEDLAQFVLSLLTLPYSNAEVGSSARLI
jgi:hypothetical protein